MKKNILLPFIIFSLIISISQLSFTYPTAEKVLERVTQYFHTYLFEVEENIRLYQKKAQALTPDKSSIKTLQTIHLQTRNSFKKIEFLLEYYDHYSIKKSINGAPLLTVEPSVPEVIEVEPVGLQVLDELVFGENPFEAKQEILELTAKLQKNFNHVYQYQKGLNISHRHIFEAARQELVRVFTLGVTGFDTPGSVNAIPEAKYALEGIHGIMDFYFPLVHQKDKNLSQQLENLLKEAISFLEKNNDFDSFDRLRFLKEFINPIFENLYKAHLVLNIELIEETNPQPQPTNYHAINIFDEDFLNPSYYAGIDLKSSQAKKRIELGKLLFFDPILSSNNERACASCHQPDKAFTDGLPKSLAINGKATIQRNAPTIINAVFAERYFYDLREPNIERQIKHVVLDSLEFSTDFFEIAGKLNQSETYNKLFEEAYGEFPQYTVSKWSISDALANYVASLTSFNSPVDQYIRGERTALDAAVKRGFNLFMGKAACGTCHFAPTFNGTVPPVYDESESEVLGVPNSADTLNPILDSDLGRFASSRPIDQAPFYVASFKTVTVRNIAKTGPYMHNGVYETLEEVIDFYNRGGGAGMGMNVPYQTLPDAPLNLSQNEISDLVAFMEALTDETTFNDIPKELPSFQNHPEWNNRKIGGEY